ncbi:hypothetical protein GGI21_000272 [Coemansia aciculifera]|nr:hypothetical protein GGI21_000272 [Coemansia aciculifera]
MSHQEARDLHLLVYSYLLHTNCARTASAFARTCGLATAGSLTSSTAPAYLSEPFTKPAATAASVGKTPAVLKKSDSGTKNNNNNEEEEEEETVSVPATTDAELIAHHIEYLRIRQSICASIEAREPEVALDLLSTYFRSVLIPPPSEHMSSPTSPLPLRPEFNATLLRFRLDIQYYVELIAKHKELDALQFGQRTLWRYTDIFDTWLNHSISLTSSTAGESLRMHYSSASSSSAATTEDEVSPSSSSPESSEVVSRLELKHKRAEIMRHITNVAALVAYPDPSQSPLAYLLTQERRKELAAAVNDAILCAMRFPKEPPLVTVARQLATTSAYLVGYRSSSNSSSNSSSSRKKEDHSQQQQLASGSGSRNYYSYQQQQQPWLLDAFVNSDDSSTST